MQSYRWVIICTQCTSLRKITKIKENELSPHSVVYLIMFTLVNKQHILNYNFKAKYTLWLYFYVKELEGK